MGRRPMAAENKYLAHFLELESKGIVILTALMGQ
jgi:hypothetical protein